MSLAGVMEEDGSEARFIPFLTISNLAGSVTEDVQRIRKHPLIPADIPFYGYMYDIKTGRLLEVPEATEAGKVQAQRNRLSID